MKLAKPLKVGGSPLMIVTESVLRRGRMVKQLRRSVDREAHRAARNLARSPEHDKPRKKVVDMEGERVIPLSGMKPAMQTASWVSCLCFHRGL